MEPGILDNPEKLTLIGFMVSIILALCWTIKFIFQSWLSGNREMVEELRQNIKQKEEKIDKMTDALLEGSAVIKELTFSSESTRNEIIQAIKDSNYHVINHMNEALRGLKKDG